jgi:release factor glutamine methyltransferase
VPFSIANVILEAAQTLRNAGVPEARRDASVLLAHLLGCDRTFIISHAEDPVSDDVLSSLKQLVERRAQGEPIQYITGSQEFFSLDFEVTRDVLIPRPETELIVEIALDLIRKDQTSALVCDVGTGSGCIAISILRNRPQARAVAIDVSRNAIAVARRNARRHSVDDRMTFVVSDCFEAISKTPTFDLVVSNPPYVHEQTVPYLQREVRDYEPRIALTPGGDGLSMIRRLLSESPLVIKSGGYLLIEMGFDQGDAVLRLVDTKIWRLLDTHKDLQGIPRTLTLQKTAP